MTRGAAVPLTCHPDSRCTAVRGIEAQVGRGHDGVLAVTFTLEGDLGRLQVPVPGPRLRVDGLWQHTCFEAFVAVDGARAYHEINLAPSGEWALYTFRDYREIAALADEDWAPETTVQFAAHKIELAALIRLDPLFPTQAHVPLRLALSYWALRHPAGQADFHHPDAFALRLDPGDGDPVTLLDSQPVGLSDK
jgi:hypothetical protein